MLLLVRLTACMQLHCKHLSNELDTITGFGVVLEYDRGQVLILGTTDEKGLGYMLSFHHSVIISTPPYLRRKATPQRRTLGHKERKEQDAAGYSSARD
jgi:hypothetical protein